jgi:type I restriction-modification system DNA methylase subunit
MISKFLYFIFFIYQRIEYEKSKELDKNIKNFTKQEKTNQIDTISEFQQFWQHKTYSIFKDLINKKTIVPEKTLRFE